MKKYLIGAITCILAFSTSYATARELSAGEKNIIAEKVKAQLKDPDSAKIEWQDYKGGEGYCAHVNAKNSYGGFAGKALIIASVKTDKSGTIVFADAIVHSGEMEAMMKSICIDDGYSA
ncbi:hypothetical protein [Serratia fonticola]|uniref:hypothetical protein n=1 Tax=Serratia fonticola TaxID=47917 RepID=UPI0015C64D08|nr:hypothetical protein [Serratia fonticola]NYA15765.1 hypothetical protein [Serratia fonticola]NYA35885.1 hypothetical protein [Serratia fonticola]